MLNLIEFLKSAVREEYNNEQRKGIHVSDLVLCLRRAARHRLNPAPLTDIDLRNFNQGRSHHHTVQQLAKTLKNKGFVVQSEKALKKFGIIAHIDLVVDGLPVEVKTTRSRKAAPSNHHFQQLKYYMAMLGSSKGKIIMESYNADENPWSETDIDFVDGELEMVKDKLLGLKRSFVTALKEKDWFLAPHVKDDPDKKWLCERCPYKEECYAHND